MDAFITRRGGGSSFVYQEIFSAASAECSIPLSNAKKHIVWVCVGGGNTAAYIEYTIENGEIQVVVDSDNSDYAIAKVIFSPTIDGNGNLKPFSTNYPSPFHLTIVGV